jgi:NAD(P)-dependent dehydrogenase (short-subunit alcohol dehydrogenase family)
MISKDAVWLVTGCSKGLGRAIVTEALRADYRVVATARNPSTLDGLLAEAADRALAVALDVTRPDEVAAAVEAAEHRFGAVDVLVNNAGYGYVGAIEEGEEDGVRALFETDVFGLWSMTKAVLPGMRRRGRGHVVNISSVGGMVTYPAVGFYHMAKFAVEGFSDTLAQELAPFGIGVTVVAPGAFRTDFRGSSMQQSAVRLPEYADTAGKARDRVLAGHGTQENDPALGARAIITAVEADAPPVHLVIGGDALDQVRAKLARLSQELDTWEGVTRSTKFEETT